MYAIRSYYVTIGIKAAKHEHLVFTDADCYPQSDHWLKQMIQGFNENKEIVLGFGPYENQKGLINKWLSRRPNSS